jgi:hypothetical protein
MGFLLALSGALHRSYSPFSTVACLTESREDTVSPGSSGIKSALDRE